jgi:predicted secreted protein
MALLRALARSLPLTIVVVVATAAIVIGLAVKPFGLTVAGAIALYFVVWWTVLFAVLPLRFGADEEISRVPGAEPGAPATPALREKAILTTIASDLVFLLVCAVLPLTGL